MQLYFIGVISVIVYTVYHSCRIPFLQLQGKKQKLSSSLVIVGEFASPQPGSSMNASGDTIRWWKLIEVRRNE